VGDNPDPPRDGAAQLDAPEIDDREPLADLRQAAGMFVPGTGRGRTLKARLDGVGDVMALLFGRRGDAGDRRSIGTGGSRPYRQWRRYRDAGNGEVGQHLQAAGTVQPARRAIRQPVRRARPGGPDQRSWPAGSGRHTPRRRGAFGTAWFTSLRRRCFRASAAHRPKGSSAKPASTRGPASISTTRGPLSGVDVAGSRAARVLCQFGNGAGEFDAGRTGADDDEGQKRGAPLRIGLALGAFEGQPRMRRRSVVASFQRLQARRERSHSSWPKYAWRAPVGENEGVIGQRIAIIEQHALFHSIDAGHGGGTRS